MAEILSLDLAASNKRGSGLAWQQDNKIISTTLYNDSDIIDVINQLDPKVVGIDAPLSIINGRETIDDNNGIHYRECDLELKKLGIKFFPITLGPMRSLTKRGMLIAGLLRESGIIVKEIYPGASADMLDLPRKNKEVINLIFKSNAKNIDESDAILGLFTLQLHKNNLSINLSGHDGEIIIPKPGIYLGDLKPVQFIERRNRFVLSANDNRKKIYVYTRDTGSMAEYLTKGNTIYITRKLGGKYKYLLKAVHDPVNKYMVLADPFLDNILVKKWLKLKGISASSHNVKRKSLFDLSWGDCVCEVKGSNMHLNPETAVFPDVYSTRAERHFKELTQLKGCRWIVFVSHFPAKSISINPKYPKLNEIIGDGINKGINIKGISTRIYNKFLFYDREIPFH